MKRAQFKIALVNFAILFASVGFADPKNNPIHALHYEVQIRPNISKKSLSGETKIDFESLIDGLDQLSFQIHELQIQTVFIRKEAVKFSTSTGTLTIPLKTILNKGQKSQVTIGYKGTPTSGIVFGENSVYTSYDTCYWMICDQDNPGDKASLKLTVDVPKNLTVVASGTNIKVSSLPQGLTRHVWSQDRAYSPYLFGFAAGNYKSAHLKAGKTDLDFFSDVVDEKTMVEFFQDTEKMITFFEDKSGLAFPHARYAQIVVRGDEAQEVSSYSVLGNDNVEPILKDAKADWAIVHELAHQWWGNYITCSTWDHFWLNEGLVVFMTAAYKEHRWGKSEYDKEMEVAKKRYQMAKDAGFDVPLTKGQSLTTLKMRRAIVYSKGAVFLDTLRTQMGEISFWKGLKEYSIKFAGKIVDSHDFEKIMVSNGNSETTKLFQNWVF